MFCVKTTSVAIVTPLELVADADHLPTNAIGDI